MNAIVKISTAASALLQRASSPLDQLGIAPENPRANVPADELIPQLAETLFAEDGKGQMQPLFVRAGRRGEKTWMALDGRRRIFAFQLLLEQGLIGADHPIDIYICETKEQQARATVLLNSEAYAPHDADRIEAIGKLVKKKMSTAAIARALGFKEIEVKRFSALANVPADAITAFRKDTISLEGLRLIARLPSEGDRQLWAEQTLRTGWLDENRIRSILRGATADEEDARFSLVSQDEYLAAGGRIERDLFGELPANILDAEILDQVWRAKAEPIAAVLRERGYEVFVPGTGSVQVPEGMEPVSNYFYMFDVAIGLRTEAHEVQSQLQAVRPAVAGLDLDVTNREHLTLIADMVELNGSLRCFGGVKRELGAITLTPSDSYKVTGGFATKPYVPPAIDPADGDEDDGDDTEAGLNPVARTPARADRLTVVTPKIQVDTAGLTHALHERQTDMGTKGLMRDLADDLNGAFIVLLAQMFKGAVLNSSNYHEEAALKIQLTRFTSQLGVEQDLDGVVRERLKVWGERYAESGLRPIGFIESLSHGERMQLMAEMTAISLDLREHRADSCNASRRVEASEIAALCEYNIRTHWTLRGDYLAAHPKKLQLVMLEEMGADVAKADKLKKTELTEFVQEQATLNDYAPKVLDWSPNFVAAAQASDFDGDAEDDEALDGEDADAVAGDAGDEDRAVEGDDGVGDDVFGDEDQASDAGVEALVARMMEESGLPEHVVRQQIDQAARVQALQAAAEAQTSDDSVEEDLAVAEAA